MIPLSCTLSAAFTVAAPALEGLRELRPPLAPSPLPPFLLTALLTLAAAGTAALGARRVGKGEIDSPAGSETAPDRLALLRERYLAGAVTELQLYDAVADLVSGAWPVDASALTADEAIAQARGVLTEETLARAALLLQHCQAVRYGRLPAEKEAALTTLDEAAATMLILTERKR